MRIALLILAAMALTGCAAQSNVATATPVAPARYQPSAAGGLAFDPPVLAGTPRMDLSRADRQPQAFAGYSDSSTTVFYIATDNEDGGYARQSTTATYGTNYR